MKGEGGIERNYNCYTVMSERERETDRQSDRVIRRLAVVDLCEIERGWWGGGASERASERERERQRQRQRQRDRESSDFYLVY